MILVVGEEKEEDHRSTSDEIIVSGCLRGARMSSLPDHD